MPDLPLAPDVLTFQEVRLAGKACERGRGDSTSRERNAGGEPHEGALRVVSCVAVDCVARRSCSCGYTSLLAPCHSGAEATET